jgi:HD superfamily phosphohydrolase
MIMGCRYDNPSNQIEKFENKLISMLNGSGIDVDSLDYIQRDSWISGVNNVEIDYQRLLSSIMIMPDKQENPQIVFKKSALSVLDNISIGRNFLYKWIYSHHIVNYEQNLLKGIIKKINLDSEDELCNSFFSVQSFKDSVIFNKRNHYLPSDDDLMYIIKSFYGTDDRIEELLSRKYRFKALWKTYFEFDEMYFTNVTSENRMKISSKINKGKLDPIYDNKDLLCIDAKPTLKSINPNDFFINIDGKLIDASKATASPNQNLNYFILYVSPILTSKKTEILDNILRLQG